MGALIKSGGGIPLNPPRLLQTIVSVTDYKYKVFLEVLQTIFSRAKKDIPSKHLNKNYRTEPLIQEKEKFQILLNCITSKSL